MVLRRKAFVAFLILAVVAPGSPSFSQIRVSLPVSAPLPVPAAVLAPAQTSLAPALPALPAPAAERKDSPVSGPEAPVAAPVAAAPSEQPSSSNSSESAKAAADEFFDVSARVPGGGEPVVAAETPAAPAALPAAGSRSDARAASPILDPGHTEPHLRDRVRDRARYGWLTSRSFFWYMFTHIKDMWPAYLSRWKRTTAEGGAAVLSPRSFFTAMRVTGMSGRFYTLGGSALEDDLVIVEFRNAFKRYFDSPGVGAREREAFERFMARAKDFNAEKRAHTNMYKNIRDPLIRASTMSPARLADYFNSLLPPEKEQSIRDFQKSGRMDEVREAFLDVLRKTLDEEDPNAPDRVRAAIVLGSFASGAAGPSSDFDVEALVNGAVSKRLPAFSRRLIARWAATGHDVAHPASVQSIAYWPSWGLVNFVQDRHYIIVSPEPALAARLSRQAYENPAIPLERGRTVRGRVNRLIQRAIVTSATLAADLRALF